MKFSLFNIGLRHMFIIIIHIEQKQHSNILGLDNSLHGGLKLNDVMASRKKMTDKKIKIKINKNKNKKKKE